MGKAPTKVSKYLLQQNIGTLNEIRLSAKNLRKESQQRRVYRFFINKRTERRNQSKTVEEFYLSLIEDLKQKGRIGNSYAYLNSYNTLRNFNKGKKLNYTFSHIDVSFCKNLRTGCEARGTRIRPSVINSVLYEPPITRLQKQRQWHVKRIRSLSTN